MADNHENFIVQPNLLLKKEGEKIASKDVSKTNIEEDEKLDNLAKAGEGE
jgi:hypothetical protein